MNILISIFVGIAWGALGAFLNISITRSAVKKKTDRAVVVSSVCRMAVNIAWLTAVVLTRELIPTDYRFVLVGTAISLSLSTIIMSFALAKKM